MGKRYRKNGENDNELGRIIRRQMRKLKLSRTDLAKRMGKDPTYVSQLFQYDHQLRYASVQELAEALEVPIARIIHANLGAVIRRVETRKKK